jgi:hypothetical protein
MAESGLLVDFSRWLTLNEQDASGVQGDRRAGTIIERRPRRRRRERGTVMSSARGTKWTLVVLACAIVGGCTEELEQALGLDQPAALRESELPNCSRVVNCCDRLGQGVYGSVVPAAVHTTCNDTLGVAAGTVIGQYQSARTGVNGQSGLTPEQRTSLLGDLRSQWQNAVEPGCRCFLDETIGMLPNLATPADCGSFTTTGALAGGATCDDGIGAVLQTAASGL